MKFTNAMNVTALLNRRSATASQARNSGDHSRNHSYTCDPPLPASPARIALIAYLQVMEDEERRNGPVNAAHLANLMRSNRRNHQQRVQLPNQILHQPQTGYGSEDGDSDQPTSVAFLSQLPRARIFPKDRIVFGHDDTECSICCSRLVDGVVLMRLCCGHVFHVQCLTPWLSHRSTCPGCRYEMPTEGVAHSEAAETNRRERMKGRVTYRCRCPSSGMHSCFFVDPSRSLSEQYKTPAFFST
jgi:hypothetical protein